MNLEQVHTVYFLGIGGIGMSALARYFNARGVAVSGYDRTQTPLTEKLVEEGIRVHFNDSETEIPGAFKQVSDEVLVVYTPAIPKEHKGWNALQAIGHRCYKRSEVLGLITQNSNTIGLAGTHGKTTTSTILAHLLTDSGYGCDAFLGGISTNYNTNTLLDSTAKTTVVEADEFDRSFLTLYPNVAVITSMDADHLDIYGDKSALEESFKLFVQQIKPEGLLIYKSDLEGIKELAPNSISYSITEKADVYAENVRVENGAYYFDLVSPYGNLEALTLGLPGAHNVENAVATIVAAQWLGVDNAKIKTALASFSGVKRRFEYHIKDADLVYIDDYAHHPTELKATINSVRELYPDKKITGVFQPHLYTRTRDFADDFAASLDLLNELLLLDIYPAREEPIPGVNGQMLLDKVTLESKALVSKQELVENLQARELEVLLTLGAGDIDQCITPIKNSLINRN